MKKTLFFLVFILLVSQLCWITFTPLWQTPDEQAHFGQVAILAETGKDYLPNPNLSREILDSEIIMGTKREPGGNNLFTYHPNFNIDYSQTIFGPFERQLGSLPKIERTTFTINESTSYPPLYYRLGSWFYRVAFESSLFDRVFAVRILTGIIGVLIFVVVYLIGKILYKEPIKQISLAILTSFAPMFMFVNSGVTSDSLFNLIFPLFLLICLLLIRKGLNVLGLIGVGIVFLLGIYTKPQANIMAFVLAPLLMILFYKAEKKKYYILPIVGVSIFFFGEIITRVMNGVSIFPEASSVNFSAGSVIEHFQFTLNHSYREVLPWYWGVFRWLSLALPSFLRQITNALTIGSFAAFIVYLVVLFKKHKFSQEFLMKAFMFSALLIYFLALTAFDYGFRQAHEFSFGIQGRYFFPVAVVISMIIIDGMGFLFDRISKGFYLIFLDIAMILFNVITFFYLMFTYYAKSLPEFFIQASQYKPLWLKYPVNLIILSGYLICSLLLLLFITRRKLSKVL